MKYGHILNEFLNRKLKKHLFNQRLFYGHPIEISPLAKKNPKMKDLLIVLNYLL